MQRRPWRLLVGLGSWALVVAMAVSARPARACGGFFCSQTQPVNQAAERIIFVDHEDGTVTAVVQILYDGPSERFSWLLPVPGQPTVGVSSNIAFQRLQAATNPLYQLTTTVEGTCSDAGVPRGGAVDAAADAGSGGEPGVTVLASGSVGPYNYTLITVDAGQSDPAQAALDWLAGEGFDVTATGPDLIRPYIEEGLNLLAFRLSKDATAGEIRPVVLHYTSDLPMIPIKLTAVAANDDMGVLVWVLHQYRAIPSNYRSLILNEAAINWLNPGGTYDAVVTAAADEAGGQGFVTEYAGASAGLAGTIWSPYEAQDFEDRFVGGSWSGRMLDLVEEAIFSYGGFDGLEEAIGTLPNPQGVPLDELLQCPRCHWQEADLADVDPAAFVDALRTDIVQPLADTEALLEARPYITRMYTTLSAREMTVDPCFDFNPDLPDVSNVHTATRVIECRPDVSQADAPWSVALPQGGEVRGVGASWPFATGGDMPANREVLQAAVRGQGEVIADNTGVINQALEAQSARVRGAAAGDEIGCGCGVTGAALGGWLSMLGGLCALGVLRRRGQLGKRGR